jgi:hypothetical protein
VNGSKYLKLRNEEERREYNRVKKTQERAKKKGVAAAGLVVKSSLECDCGAIYDAYPKHVGKPKAMVSIRRAVEEFGYEYVLARTVAYAQARVGQDLQFTPLPVTWFNQQRFNDDPETWKPSQATNFKYAHKPLATQQDAIDRQMREIERAADRAMKL